MSYDSIIAGAGIWGCTVARRLADVGKNVLVLEKRTFVGGNVRCEIDDETGIEIHKMREYSAAWKPGDEPYYPIDNTDSRELLLKYQAEAATIPNLIVGGRLGGYKYYDMDRSIDAALELSLV